MVSTDGDDTRLAPIERLDRDLSGSVGGFLLGGRELPCVTRVMPRSSGTSRWFDGPVTRFLQDGPSVEVRIAIGVDRHHSAAATTGLVASYLRARLIECGFDFIEIRVRTAVFE